jgi:hypothetical protein
MIDMVLGIKNREAAKKLMIVDYITSIIIAHSKISLLLQQ